MLPLISPASSSSQVLTSDSFSQTLCKLTIFCLFGGESYFRRIFSLARFYRLLAGLLDPAAGERDVPPDNGQARLQRRQQIQRCSGKQWTVDCGPWNMDNESWTMDHKQWTVKNGSWTIMDHRQWIQDTGLQKMDQGQ